MPPNNYFGLTSLVVDGVDVPAKRCRTCEVVKPLTEYYKHKTCLGGVSSKCNTCCGIKGKYKKAVIVQIMHNGSLVDAKRCVTCEEILPLYEFTVIKGKKKGVGGRYARCNPCERKYRQELDKRPGVRQRRLERSRAYTKTYRVRKRKISKIHRKNNIEAYKAKDANRWARKKLLRNELTTEQYKGVMLFFNQLCALTGENEDITLEHFIPLSIGHGGSYVGNVYPAVGSLNYSKSGANPFEWIKRDDIVARVDPYLWDQLITYLAGCNGLSKEEYISFVNWCFANPRTLAELEYDNTDSLELYDRSK